MTAVPSPNTFELLQSCVQHLGAAILAIWGVDEKGACRCPKGAACNNTGKHPNSKLCPNGVKNATREAAILRQWVKQAPTGNWAIRCGEPIPGGGFLGAFDWDPRNGAEESLAEIRARGLELPESVGQISGGGGGHRLYKFDKAPASRCLGPGLDLQGADKYIVISPSRHRSGSPYLWELGQAPGECAIAPAPRWIVESTDEAMGRPVVDGVSARDTVLGEAFVLAGRAGPVMPDGSMMVNCPQSHLHSDTRGHGHDASSVVLPPAGGSRAGGFKCLHGHCANLKWQEVMNFFPKEIREEANKKYPRLGIVPPAYLEKELAQEKPDTNAVKVDAPDLDEVRKRLHFKMSKSGGSKIVSDIVNANIILTYDPRWKGVLRYDEFAQVLRFTRTPPWHPDDVGKDKSEVWTDEDTTRLDLWFRRNWALELPGEKIRESVYVVGRRDGMNPLTDYLNALQWDGTRRLDTWLCAYAGVTDTPYTRIAGRKWALSAVARAFEPGVKVDACLVLEGPQGKGKSTLLRTLVPNASWFSDTPIDLASKDAYVALRGKWIIELAELASLKKADLDRAKAFFSSAVDSYRPPYGREQITVARTAVFAGTVNLGEYLNDATGGRRFIPVKCGVIDLRNLTADRDQLWAETAQLYKAWVARGRPQSECLWWPSPEELPLFEAEQMVRQVAGTGHPWTEAIAVWTISPRAKEMVAKKGFLLIREIAKGALDMDDKDLTQAHMTHIGVIMVRELKWQKKRVLVAGARAWGYEPPNERS